MSRKFQKTTGTFELAPAGSHFAVLTGMAFVGLQHSRFTGEPVDTVALTYELEADGSRYEVSESGKASNHESSKFFSRIVELNGGKEPQEGGELAELLGRGCLVTVVHKSVGERTYANVKQVAALPAGMEPLKPSGALTYYDVHEPDPAAFARLNSLAKKMVESRVRTNSGTDAPTPFDTADDDIPFDIA